MTVPTWRARVLAITESARFQRTIIILIVANAVILGLETSPAIMQRMGGVLRSVDGAILMVFVVEILMRLAAHGRAFFRDPWSLFDSFVVGVALVPATEAFSVVRALRVLRVLRIASAVPRMRRVVEALLHALPGLGSVVSILLLVFYVAGVMATQLFGSAFPDWFGTLPRSLYSLFQIMTLESWSMGIVRPVMEIYPLAWIFFVPFVIVTSFAVLNLFIALIVNSMQSVHLQDRSTAMAEAELAHNEREALLRQVERLADEIRQMRKENRADPQTPVRQ